MTSVLRRISRVMLMACLAHAITPATSAPVDPALGEGKGTASSMPEVRLRKLHLVRPDLIPYPIAYEVYC